MKYREQVESYFQAHEAMGHEGLGCGCLDGIDALADEAETPSDTRNTELTLSAAPEVRGVPIGVTTVAGGLS